MKDITTKVLGDTDLTLAGAGGTVSLGTVFPTGMDLAGLTAYLKTAVYTGQAGSGQKQFTLVLAPPPPPTITISSASYDANNDQLTLSWNSVPAATYTIENTTQFFGNGAGTSWDNLTTGIPSGGITTTKVIDAPSPGTYYRIRKE